MPLDTNMTVLCVDDFSTMRRIIIGLLKQLGFKNILEADDGATALETLKSRPVDLVISDWNMPKMTGLELLKALRADERFKSLPFLTIAAESEKDQVLTAAAAGVSGYLVKPFKAATLQEKLEKILGK